MKLASEDQRTSRWGSALAQNVHDHTPGDREIKEGTSAMSQETDEHQDRLPSSEATPAQKSEEHQELGAGIDQLHQHIQEIADHLKHDQQYVADIQKEIARESEAARHITESLKPATKQENEE
jgi:molecular chaperone GrpE (heat shock protein)